MFWNELTLNYVLKWTNLELSSDKTKWLPNSNWTKRSRRIGPWRINLSIKNKSKFYKKNQKKILKTKRIRTKINITINKKVTLKLYMASMSFEETRGKEGKRIKTRSKSNHSTKTTINHPNKKRTTWCFQWYDRMKFLVVTRHCTRRLYSTCSSHTLHALTFLLYIYIYLNTVYFLSQCNNNNKKKQ